MMNFNEHIKETHKDKVSIINARNSYIKYLRDAQGIEEVKQWYVKNDYKTLYEQLKKEFRLSGCKCNASNVIIHVKE